MPEDDPEDDAPTDAESSPEESPPEGSPPPRRRRWWRRWRRLLVLTVVLLLLGALLRVSLPTITAASVAHFGAEALGAPVSVENVDFHLLRGGLRVEGLRIGEDHARWDHVEVELNWRALLDRRVEVQALSLHGPRLRLIQGPDGTIALTPRQLARPERAGSVVAEAEDPAEEGADAGRPWSFELRRLSIVDQGLDLTDASGRVVLMVDFDTLTLERLRFDDQGLHLGELLWDRPRVWVHDELALPSPAEDTPDAAPLPVHIEHLLSRDGEIILQGEDAELRLTSRVEARDVTTAAGGRIPVSLELGLEGAPLRVDGELGLDPPAFTGSASLSDLGLPHYVAVRLAAEAPQWAGWWRDGRLGWQFDVAFTPAGVDVAGRLEVQHLELADPADGRRALKWQSLEIVAREVHLPLDGGGPPQIDLERLALATPVAGWVLPAREPPADDARAPTAATTDAQASPAQDDAPAPEEPTADVPLVPALDLALDDLVITGGDLSLFVEDLDYEGGVKEFELSGRQLRYPGMRALDLRLQGLTAAQSPLVLAGSLDDGTGAFTLMIESLPLPRFSPLVADAAGYHLHDGTLTLDTRAAITGDRYVTESTLVLQDLKLSADDPGAFRDMFGMPLDLSLALLRDPGGKITLSVPLTLDGGAVEAGLGPLVSSALREALVGALTSPFKLLGAAFDAFGGEDEELALEPFACVPGEVALVADEGERLDQLVALLEERPALALRLRGGAGPDDRDALALRLLQQRAATGAGLPELDGAGWFAPDRVAEALAERARGGAGLLDAEDQALLERYVAAVEPPPEAYADLARRRAEALRAALVLRHGLDAGALELGEPSDQPPPAVHFGFTVRDS